MSNGLENIIGKWPGDETDEQISEVLNRDSNRHQAFRDVLALVRDWRDNGRCGFSLPVLRGELLDRLEKML